MCAFRYTVEAVRPRAVGRSLSAVPLILVEQRSDPVVRVETTPIGTWRLFEWRSDGECDAHVGPISVHFEPRALADMPQARRDPRRGDPPPHGPRGERRLTDFGRATPARNARKCKNPARKVCRRSTIRCQAPKRASRVYVGLKRLCDAPLHARPSSRASSVVGQRCSPTSRRMISSAVSGAIGAR